jgi:hypothetical protein
MFRLVRGLANKQSATWKKDLLSSPGQGPPDAMLTERDLCSEKMREYKKRDESQH